ncbi:hypothetical protein COO60DRAFT_88565 [Scenedesmus sp. NREL 46B-D3]|nr:hypothetical protein COO60DRAFT_88565 [Scenedesmus sp. NREL 46B-D3]
MLVLPHLRQVAASAAHAELALLRTAPALLEALCQHWHCLAASRSSCSNFSGYSVEPTCQNLCSSSSSSSSSSNMLLTRNGACSPNPSTHPYSSHLQHRAWSSSSATIADNIDGKNSSSSMDGQGQQQQQQQQQQRQDAYRRGFGAKVALPSTDVLHEVLVGHAATIKLRAYHIGARIHIGQVLQHAQQLGCRTNSGKDYCIIWPPDKPNPWNSALKKAQSSQSTSLATHSHTAAAAAAAAVLAAAAATLAAAVSEAAAAAADPLGSPST